MGSFKVLLEWFAALPKEYAFLLALPFIVAAAAFLKDAIVAAMTKKSPKEKHKPGRAAHC